MGSSSSSLLLHCFRSLHLTLFADVLWRFRWRTCKKTKLSSVYYRVSLVSSPLDHSFRKVRLRVDEVQGRSCLTNFHGLDFTSVRKVSIMRCYSNANTFQDKLRSLVRKWQTLIEANVTVKTTDASCTTGYRLHLALTRLSGLSSSSLRYRFHETPTQPDQKDHLRCLVSDPRHSEEDDGNHSTRSHQLHTISTSYKAYSGKYPTHIINKQ